MTTDKNFDDVIDPDENMEALAEAMGQPIKEEVTILELLNKRRVKVRYIPQSIASSLEFDDGTALNPPGTRKPKFNYRRWAREILPKLNSLALRNIQIVNDLDSATIEIPRGGVRLSLISPGEFRRLQDLCFPGSSDNDIGEDEDNEPRRKGSKGLRRGEPAEAGS